VNLARTASAWLVSSGEVAVAEVVDSPIAALAHLLAERVSLILRMTCGLVSSGVRNSRFDGSLEI